MSRFVALPEEVCAAILTEWLGNWKTLAAMDVAFCNRRSRVDFHSVLSHQVIKFSDDSVVLETIARKKHLETFLLWVRSRTVKLYALYVNVRLIGDVVSVGSFSFPNISRVTFLGEKRATVSVEQFRSFISYFPCIREVDCSRWSNLPNKVLAVFSTLSPPCALQVLNLDNCDEVLGVTVSSLAVKNAAHLQELRCAILDDEELTTIADHCHGLKVLSLACDDLTEESVLHICRENTSLEAITLGLYDHSVPSIITDELLIQLTRICPHLRSIHIDTNAGVCERSFQWIVTNCPDIRMVKTFGYQYTVKADAGGHKVAELSFGMVGDIDEIKTIIENTLLPITHINAKYAKVKLDLAAFHLIADRCGASLVYLSGDVDESVPSAAVEYLLSRCPCLVTMMLSKFGTLTNDVLLKIPDYCPRLHILGLECAKKITDVAMLKVLGAYKPHQLTSIGLHYCRALTIAVVLKAAELFPKLDWILVQGTAMHRDIIWQHAVVENRVHFSAKSTLVTGQKKWFEKELEMKVQEKHRPKFRIW